MKWRSSDLIVCENDKRTRRDEPGARGTRSAESEVALQPSRHPWPPLGHSGIEGQAHTLAPRRRHNQPRQDRRVATSRLPRVPR